MVNETTTTTTDTITVRTVTVAKLRDWINAGLLAEGATPLADQGEGENDNDWIGLNGGNSFALNDATATVTIATSDKETT